MSRERTRSERGLPAQANVSVQPAAAPRPSSFPCSIRWRILLRQPVRKPPVPLVPTHVTAGRGQRRRTWWGGWVALSMRLPSGGDERIGNSGFEEDDVPRLGARGRTARQPHARGARHLSPMGGRRVELRKRGGGRRHQHILLPGTAVPLGDVLRPVGKVLLEVADTAARSRRQQQTLPASPPSFLHLRPPFVPSVFFAAMHAANFPDLRGRGVACIMCGMQHHLRATTYVCNTAGTHHRMHEHRNARNTAWTTHSTPSAARATPPNPPCCVCARGPPSHLMHCTLHCATVLRFRGVSTSQRRAPRRLCCTAGLPTLCNRPVSALRQPSQLHLNTCPTSTL
eukprot:355821-Chlamydomonas_euryale.AAC.10